jgi:serine kinase of HPr protein (carbohydrate metabolism regulator)
MTVSDIVTLRVLGTTFRVAAPPAVVVDLSRLWLASIVPAADDTTDIVPLTTANGGLHEPARSAEELSVRINATALRRVNGLIVHAGVVSAQGRVIAIPGRSGQGKSTVTAACVQQGLGYVSDEALVLDWETGEVQAYPKPLALSAASLRLLELDGAAATDEKTAIAAERLGAVELRPGAVSDIVVISRSDGEATLRGVHRSQAITELMPRCVNHYERPEQAFDLLCDLARSARTWELSYRSPQGAAELITELGRD